MSDDFGQDERRALDAWDAPEPDAGFAERVLARAEADRSVPWARLGGLALVAAASVAVVVALSQGTGRPAIEGAHLSAARATLDLGGRAIAVAEPQTQLSWHVAPGGDARVEQKSGNTFYRVDRGGGFVVDTPAGAVRVAGTCFRVEVRAMKPKHAALAGAALGATLSAVAMVTVYEGTVVAASSRGEARVEAGEQARLVPNELPRIEGAAGRPDPAGDAQTAAGASASGAGGHRTLAPTDPVALQSVNRELRAEVDGLREQVAQLTVDLDEARATSRRHKTYDLSQEELDAMADRCEIRWDMPRLGPEPERLGEEAVAELEVDAAQRRAINQAHAAEHEHLLAELRAAYTELTGDANTGSLAAGAMFAEINDKTPREEIRRIYRMLSAERAGRVEPPGADVQQPPAARIYRLYTGAGPRLQRRLTAAVGDELAQKVRDRNGGFASKYRSSHGCK